MPTIRDSAFALVGAVLFSSMLLGQQPPSRESEQGSPSICVSIGDHSARVEADGELFAEYDYRRHAKPILYPVIGPGGVPITRNYPMVEGVTGEASDHTHHKSVWFAHGNVNGLDFWSEKARIENRSIRLIDDDSGWPGFVAANEWMDGDKPLLTEQATLRFADRGDTRFIDFDFVLTANLEARLGDTKEGTFAIRTHPNLQLKRDDGAQPVGHAENSAGQTDGAIWGQRAEWVSYFGELDGQPFGIAILDHPQNLRHPTTWHARDYGLVAANPFGLHDFLQQPPGSGDHVLQPREQLRLRYRLVIFRGAFDRERVADWLAEFARRG